MCSYVLLALLPLYLHRFPNQGIAHREGVVQKWKVATKMLTVFCTFHLDLFKLNQSKR